MPVTQKSKKFKAEKLNEQNAQQVANRGMNPAFTQSHGVKRYVGERDDVTNHKTGKTKNFGDGKWEEVQGYTQTKNGLLSVNGKNTKGAVTHTLTPKNDDGTPVLGKDGKPRQSGRSQVATRRQREYDIKKGLNNGWMDENGLWHGGTPPAGANVQTVAALTTG